MKKNRQELDWLRDEKYGGTETPDFFHDVHRLANGEPVDYVIGRKEFFGCRIDLSRRPFIPRPETEFWAKQAINDIQQHSYILKNVRMLCNKNEIQCLDIFAGSGCIGVSVLKHIPQAQVDFAEKDGRLLGQIKTNAELNSIPLDRYRVIRSDVFSNIRGRYDYIFANPPYLAESRREQIQESVLRHEPRAALFGGADGLSYITKLLFEAPRHLVPRGKLYFEFDTPQKKMIERIVVISKYQRSSFFKDQYGTWRYMVCER